MKVTEYLHYDPNEYATWEWDETKAEPKWGYDKSGELQYRLAEVKVIAEVDEATGDYEVQEFWLDNRRFIPTNE